PLGESLAAEGSNVPVGAVLGRIADGLAGTLTHPAAIAPGSPLSRNAGEGPERSEGGEGLAALERSGPAVRKLIEETGLDAIRVAATGPGGRISKADVIAARVPPPAPAPPTPAPATGEREVRV